MKRIPTVRQVLAQQQLLERMRERLNDETWPSADDIVEAKAVLAAAPRERQRRLNIEALQEHA